MPNRIAPWTYDGNGNVLHTGTVARSFTYERRQQSGDGHNRQRNVHLCLRRLGSAGEQDRERADHHLCVRRLRQSRSRVWRGFQRMRNVLCDHGPSRYHALIDEQCRECLRALPLRAVRAGDRGELRRANAPDGLYRHARRHQSKIHRQRTRRRIGTGFLRGEVLQQRSGKMVIAGSDERD